MAICLFEDYSISTLLPLTHLHPDFDLRCGMYTGRERVRQVFPDEELTPFTRNALVDVLAERTGLSVNTEMQQNLFIRGNALLQSELVGQLRAHRDRDMLFLCDGEMIAATVVTEGFREKLFHSIFAGLSRRADSPTLMRLPERDIAVVPARELQVDLLRFPWDIIGHNESMLRYDAELTALGSVDASTQVSKSAELLAPERIRVGGDARISSGVILDASEGPIVIDNAAVIQPHAVVLGPAYIGAHALIKVGARVCGGSSIGPSCKIAGEVEGSIFHSFANKQHDGFVGHSYFAPWTNLGADTNTSDLKNNYSLIRATLEGREFDTGCMFLGTVMADHSKCGINTMFNTGTVVGVGCNIYGGDFPPKFLPSFTWGGADMLTEYDFKRFCTVAAIVMQRRGRNFTNNEQHLLDDVFRQTAEQRRSLL
jgi:UDP-N-acetylglucosamine diphosphorylase / glucose-1-phosphate thymidylyltransferase / UDP-N-acetylgalactosamine diphosphorylase / glucosamine-1-phosphate N-acetyltransferase / galactosamine-1-phosphate N-acetyltransferase